MLYAYYAINSHRFLFLGGKVNRVELEDFLEKKYKRTLPDDLKIDNTLVGWKLLLLEMWAEGYNRGKKQGLKDIAKIIEDKLVH